MDFQKIKKRQYHQRFPKFLLKQKTKESDTNLFDRFLDSSPIEKFPQNTSSNLKVKEKNQISPFRSLFSFHRPFLLSVDLAGTPLPERIVNSTLKQPFFRLFLTEGREFFFLAINFRKRFIRIFLKLNNIGFL